ncbi:MAG: MBL fold metallo-hydrolase [bacterium]
MPALILVWVLLATEACRDGPPPQRREPRTTRRTPVVDASIPSSPSPVPRRAAVFPRYRPPKQLRVRFFSAGHADSILLRTPSGHTVLIDAGLGSEMILGENLVQRRIVPFCKRLGIARLDAFVITHPHLDHVGDPITLQRELGVNKIYVNTDGLQLVGNVLRNLAPGLSFELLHRGRTLRFGRLTLEVLHPPKDIRPKLVERSLYRQNTRSMVIRARFGRRAFLLAADAMQLTEAHILRAKLALRADVLKLGHHGVKTTSYAWLAAISPRYAVASMGARTRQRLDELPQRIRKQLRRRGIKLLRTDLDGDVEFATDGDLLTVETHPELARLPDWAPKHRREAVQRRIAAKRAGRAGRAGRARPVGP